MVEYAAGRVEFLDCLRKITFYTTEFGLESRADILSSLYGRPEPLPQATLHIAGRRIDPITQASEGVNGLQPLADHGTERSRLIQSFASSAEAWRSAKPPSEQAVRCFADNLARDENSPFR